LAPLLALGFSIPSAMRNCCSPLWSLLSSAIRADHQNLFLTPGQHSDQQRNNRRHPFQLIDSEVLRTLLYEDLATGRIVIEDGPDLISIGQESIPLFEAGNRPSRTVNCWWFAIVYALLEKLLHRNRPKICIGAQIPGSIIPDCRLSSLHSVPTEAPNRTAVEIPIWVRMVLSDLSIHRAKMCGAIESTSVKCRLWFP
jgi:hypothetical protein